MVATTTTAATKGMQNSRRFSLKIPGLHRLSKSVLRHLRRSERKEIAMIDSDYAPSTESSEPRSDENLESEITSQPESASRTDKESQREELQTEEDAIAIEKLSEEEKIQKGEVNVESSEIVSMPNDPKDLPAPLEMKSMEEERKEGEVNDTTAYTSTAADAVEEPSPQDETQGDEVSRAPSGLSSKRDDEGSDSIAKCASELEQVLLAQPPSTAMATDCGPSDSPAITGCVASSCPTATGSIHPQISMIASCESISDTDIPLKVETNPDVTLVMSEVVGSEDFSCDHDTDSQPDDEPIGGTSDAPTDDEDDTFDGDHDIVQTASKHTVRSVISRLSHASKKSIKSLVSAASGNSKVSKNTSASAAKSLKSTNSTKSKSKMALNSTKSDAESVPKPDIEGTSSLSIFLSNPSADESTNSTKSKSKGALFKSRKSDAKSVESVPKPAIDSKSSLSMLLGDSCSVDESCDDVKSTTSATYFVNEQADGEIEIETIINQDFSIPTVSLYSFQATATCDFSLGEWDLSR